MILYFSPYYDSSVFLTAGDCGLGNEYVGKDGLLNELELRAGLTVKNVDNAERVINYMNAMQKAIVDAHAAENVLFFEESFESDDFGTAELLLRWRDALVKVDWRGKALGNSEKIDGLAKIESYFNCPGTADRWRTILHEAAIRPILKPTDRIIVQCCKGDLEPVFEYLFEAINSNYSTPIVEYVSKVSGMDIYDCRGQIRDILNFKNEYEAHEWIASQNLTDNDVVAEADQAILSDIIYLLGKNTIGAKDEGIGSIMRLLPLGIELFKNPVDITVLLSYLQSHRNPLNQLHVCCRNQSGNPYYVSLATKLVEHLCDNGGFGQKWQDLIDDAIYDSAGNKLPQTTIDHGRSFINMWCKSAKCSAGEASVADVTDYVTNLSAWAGRNNFPNSDLRPQFAALQQYCSLMLKLLSGCGTVTIKVDKLSKWATHICRPINISSDVATIGSMNVVGNLADIYSHPSRLIWYAATTDNTCSYEYEFLSAKEIAALKKRYVLVPDKELVARLDMVYKKEGMFRCRNVTIVTCERISGVETVQSALLAEFTGVPLCIPIKKGVVSIQKASKNELTNNGGKGFGKATYHSVNSSVFQNFKRPYESYSSIHSIIQTPLDYVLDYIREFRQYGFDDVADVPTTEGTVAHCYIEELGRQCGNDPSGMLKKHLSDYDKILDDVLNEKGMILLTEENQLELKNFRHALNESVVTLLGIIIENGLVIEGFEYEITFNHKVIGDIYAKIDCLLVDPSDGQALIFDFKWNSGSTYEKKISENRELQLAVYKKAIETGGQHTDINGNTVAVPGRDVKFVGYYAIPKKLLYTADNVLKTNVSIEVIAQKNSMNLFKLAMNSYKLCNDNIHGGLIEEGEGLELKSLKYPIANPDLYKLDADYYDNNLKATAYGNKNIVLKGGLK